MPGDWFVQIGAAPGLNGFRPGKSAHNAVDEIAKALWGGHTQVIDADLRGKIGAHLVRYADDFVVLCKRGEEESFKVVRQVLGRLVLTLNESEAHIVDATRESFGY